MRFSVLIICMFLLLASGCLQSSPSGAPGARPGMTAQDETQRKREIAAADALDLAMQLYHDGEYLEPEAAYEYLNEAVQLDPSLTSARFHRAVLLFEQGQRDKASADIDIVITEKPDHIKARFLRGHLRLEQGDFAGAVQDYSHIIDKDDTYEEAFARRGICYTHLGRPKDAIQDFTDALALNPAHVDASYNRGLAYMALENHEAAARDLTQAVSLRSQSYDIIMARAAAFMKLGKYDRAVSDFKRALVLEPNNSTLYALLGEGLAGAKDLKGAIRAVQKALLLSRAGDEKDLTPIYQEQLDEYMAALASSSKPAQ